MDNSQSLDKKRDIRIKLATAYKIGTKPTTILKSTFYWKFRKILPKFLNLLQKYHLNNLVLVTNKE